MKPNLIHNYVKLLITGPMACMLHKPEHMTETFQRTNLWNYFEHINFSKNFRMKILF